MSLKKLKNFVLKIIKILEEAEELKRYY